MSRDGGTVIGGIVYGSEHLSVGVHPRGGFHSRYFCKLVGFMWGPFSLSLSWAWV